MKYKVSLFLMATPFSRAFYWPKFISQSYTNTFSSSQRSMVPKQSTGKASPTLAGGFLPSMIVFDLDDCLWTPEMHELPGMPQNPVQGSLNDETGETGVVGLRVGRSTVTLYPGARQTLYELATNPLYKDIVLATASSSLEPSYSHACLRGIEILPGTTMNDLFSHNQIGRTGVLSPDKRTHFTQLHRQSGVPYDQMLFFDDCNWGDNCGDVERAFGVTGIRTPYGLQFSLFEAGLRKFAKKQRE